MHIPDGYLSLQTSIPIFGAMIPIWSLVFNKLKSTLNYRKVPLLSLCAAFSFVVMMFNIPLGASSVHAVGAVFIAVVLGPSAACVAVSAALIIQAFIFGDGGKLAIGANCFNIAFAMSFVGYYVYKFIKGKSDILSKRSMLGIFLGSYVGLNTAALLTAIEFGIQPILFKTAEGIPEYGFYPLSVAVPAIMLEHLLIAGPIEGIITCSMIGYLAKFSPQIFQTGINNSIEKSEKFSFGSYKAFAFGLIIMILAVPLGLLAEGTAWGEWGPDEVMDMLGYIPRGMEGFFSWWSGFVPDYSFPGLDGNFTQSSLGYILSAIIGVLLIFTLMFVSSKLICNKEESK
ncbi:MAG: cobalt transporter CbiM [Bacillota bacterium]